MNQNGQNSVPAAAAAFAQAAPRTFLAPETIKQLREERRLTQRELAAALGVTDKAVSKWESGRGLPDITLVEPLARELGVSVAELLAGDVRANANRAGNMLRSVFYVCPICGNVVHAMGEGAFSCCGSAMLPLEAEDATTDEAHAFKVERVEDDWYVTLEHPMTKDHYVSFVAYVTMDGICMKKLYPEQQIEPRFHITGRGWIYLYCNKHGLFKQRTPSPRAARGR